VFKNGLIGFHMFFIGFEGVQNRPKMRPPGAGVLGVRGSLERPQESPRDVLEEAKTAPRRRLGKAQVEVGLGFEIQKSLTMLKKC